MWVIHYCDLFLLMDLLGPLKKLPLLFQIDSLAFLDTGASICKPKRPLKALAVDGQGLHFKLIKDTYDEIEESLKNTPIHRLDDGINFANLLR